MITLALAAYAIVGIGASMEATSYDMPAWRAFLYGVAWGPLYLFAFGRSIV
jgi:hypothetical protein